MASRVADRRGWLRLLAYGAAGVGLWLLSLVVVQTLLARRIASAQMARLGTDVAFSLRLGELALERYPMESVAELSGLTLRRELPPAAQQGRDQAQALHGELCTQLGFCRDVRTGAGNLWVELASPFEPVWLGVPRPQPRRWPPDPLSLGLSLVAAGLGLSTLVLSLEVRRPLRLLEGSLRQLGSGQEPAPLAERGAAAVRRLTRRFNALLLQLEQGRRERATMLAGIGHDLNSPLTRLRLRLHLAEANPMGAAEAGKALADLAALEQITAQFIAFARGQSEEPAAEVELDALLAELAGQVGGMAIDLDLVPLRARVHPTGLARAVANLLNNAASHGAPPVRLQLRPWGAGGFAISVIDAGPGLRPALWAQALQPFQRLDSARGGSGHCGLGLAIAERVARDHGGELVCHASQSGPASGFVVVLRGLSLDPPPSP
jgi:two-component system, OmpR family, osmolarity sensor histidine kinase EnvZ